MQTLESLKRKIGSVTELESVVKTMKAMASVRIRQYEKAADSLRQYTHTIEQGLQAVLTQENKTVTEPRNQTGTHAGIVVFGSDQGMCGQINDKVLQAFTDHTKSHSSLSGKDLLIIAVGERIRRKLAQTGQSVQNYIRVPSSVDAITLRVTDILTLINQWQSRQSPVEIWLIFNRKLQSSGFSPDTKRLLPIDRQWITALMEKPWPNRCRPLSTMEFRPLFSSLIQQYLFSNLYQAFAEAMASENQSRLQSMQHAEKNIKEELEELNMQYHRSRQMSLTEELLDIVSGFEALKTEV